MAQYKFIGNPANFFSRFGFTSGIIYDGDWHGNDPHVKTLSVSDLADNYPLDFELIQESSEIEESKSLRYNSGKPEWSLLHYPSLLPMVRVLEFGKLKYNRNNWMIGLNKEEVLDSAMRHLVELMENNEVDEESTLSHAGHVMANMMFYVFHKNNNSFTQNK